MVLTPINLARVSKLLTTSRASSHTAARTESCPEHSGGMQLEQSSMLDTMFETLVWQEQGRPSTGQRWHLG